MITYGTYPLPVLDDPGLIARIEQFIRADAFREFDSPAWTGYDASTTPSNSSMAAVRLGCLYWPREAARWAFGHFVVDQGTLANLRAAAYSSSGPVALPLVVSDGTESGTVRADLFMLPPRPLFQFGEGNLYLLTLVDDRYWWWHKSGDIAVTGGTTAWADLYTSIGTALGVTIDADTVDADYLDPAEELANAYEYLPPLLDAVAYSTGQRIIRRLDGSVEAWNPSTTVRDELVTTWGANASHGGAFEFPTDLPLLVPEKVRLSVGRKRSVASPVNGTDIYDKTLASLALDEYTGVVAKSGQKLFRSTAVALYDGASITNATELQSLADALARDWYKWQVYGDSHRLLSGIVPWDGDPTVDFVEWDAFQCRTKVMRETTNDLAMNVFHHSTGGSRGKTCCQEYTWIEKNDDYSANPWEAIVFDVSGGLKTITLPPLDNCEVGDRVLVAVIKNTTANKGVQVQPFGAEKQNGWTGPWVLVDNGMNLPVDGSYGGYWEWIKTPSSACGWTCSRFLNT